ncbi:MAG: arginine--tRNA ligase [Bacilli bacterium]|jgi:arginyl-tRNA synthetase|nr:arginine--tRNA ligase [Bacilli bacterium]
MSLLKTIEEDLTKKMNEASIPIEKVTLLESKRKDLGDYQLNDAMSLAKVLHKSPMLIAEDMKKVLEESNYFSKVEIAAVGFLNVTLKDELLIDFVNNYYNSDSKDVDKLVDKKIFLDYGGANIAKTLHVGHLRSANIGEALKRLTKRLGQEVICDVHFGDIGRQSGMVIYELRNRYPNLNYFKEEESDNWDELPITAKDLEEIYPVASTKAKEDENIMEEVRLITKELEEGKPNYVALWDKIKKLSIEDIKGVYKKFNTDFDLWEGESDCYSYMMPMLEELRKDGYLKKSEGAEIIEIKEDTDKAPMPDLVVVKSNGATLYATRELATMVSRVKRFNPDEMWYLTDLRQGLYFEQVFRAAHKTKIVSDDTKLEFFGFGTMNGPDGKPFKTRDGGALSLKSLLKEVKEEVENHSHNLETEENKDEIIEQIAVAAIKYADLLSNRTTDYIFDPKKFVDVEGKTGPYLLYTTIRMKSLLKKAKENNLDYSKYTKISEEVEKELITLLLAKNKVLHKAYDTKELNVISDYLYQLTSTYSKFYEKCHVLTEKDKNIQENWLLLTKNVYDTNVELLTILGIEIPEKM